MWQLEAEILTIRITEALYQDIGLTTSGAFAISHLDQVGFIPTHEARDNTIKALNLIHVASQFRVPCVFPGTDAEKAFDQVNWKFMFSVLSHIGLGDKMFC